MKRASDLVYVRLNAAAEAILGTPRAALLGRNDHEFFPPEVATRFEEMDRQAIDRRALTDLPEEHILSPVLGPRIFHTKKIPILDEHGEPAFLMGISRDVTEFKAATEALREEKERAQEAEQAKSRFLANISHEIRTPMNGVVGMTSLLLNGELGAEQRRQVEVIDTCAQSLLRLLNDVLDATRTASRRC